MPVFNHVASGVATGETTVTYHWDLQNPAIPGGLDVDVANGFHQEFALDGNTANDAMRQRILDDDGSAEEHAVWEQVANTTEHLGDQVDPTGQRAGHPGLHDQQQQRRRR